MSRAHFLLGGVFVCFALVPGAWAQPDAGASPVEASPIRFAQNVAPDQVKLGEPFVQELTVTHAPGERYELRVPKALGDFELRNQERRREDGKVESVTRFKLTWALFALGTRPLPEAIFEVGGLGRPARFTAPTAEVTAISSRSSPDGGGDSLYDIRPPEEVPVRTYRLLWGALALLAAAAAVFWSLREYRAWKKRRSERPPMPESLPVRTRAALEALERENLPAQERGREFYFRLSDIVRSYLGERYGFDARECTSAELLQTLAGLQAPGLPLPDLEAFVHASDLAKYAKAPVSTDACERDLAFARRLIDLTPLPDPRDAVRP